MYDVFSQLAPISSPKPVSEQTVDISSSNIPEQLQDDCNDDNDDRLREENWKSKRKLLFRNIVNRYFRLEVNGIEDNESDDCCNDHNALATTSDKQLSTINNSNMSLRAELKSNVCSLLQDELLQNTQVSKLSEINQYPSSTNIHSQVLPFNTNSKQLDYTALAICKFLHGISTPRWHSKDCYNHWLWGQWRKRLDFEVMNSMVEKMLGFMGEN